MFLTKSRDRETKTHHLKNLRVAYSLFLSTVFSKSVLFVDICNVFNSVHSEHSHTEQNKEKNAAKKK